MSRIVCVSNRVSLPDPKTGEIKAGGLAVGVKAALQSMGGGVWFGWSGEVIDAPDDMRERTPTRRNSGAITFHTVPLTRAEYNGYYRSMANEILWPLMHELDGHISENGPSFARYQDVNALFARHLSDIVQPDDVIWVHDYHLIPLGKALREAGVKNKLLFFNHIPIPSPNFVTRTSIGDEMRNNYCELLGDLFFYDQVGFQTFRDMRNFVNTLGLRANLPPRFETIPLYYQGKKTAFGVFPISIETAELEKTARESENNPDVIRLKKQLEHHRMIIGAERLDYTKGLLNRVEGISRFLKVFPRFHDQVEFLQITPLSRDDLQEYQNTIDNLRHKISQTQAAYATSLWNPIRYSEKYVPRDSLIGFFRLASVGMVTSLMDGQNLVAKEFMAAQDPQNPGSLILSKYAGAAEELANTGAFIIDPRDPADIAAKIRAALDLPLEQRRENYRQTIALLRQNDVNNWAQTFLRIAP